MRDVSQLLGFLTGHTVFAVSKFFENWKGLLCQYYLKNVCRSSRLKPNFLCLILSKKKKRQCRMISKCRNAHIYVAHSGNTSHDKNSRFSGSLINDSFCNSVRQKQISCQ